MTAVAHALVSAVVALVIGHSVQGRPLRAIEVGDRTSSTRVLVVGCIHGNECAALPVIRDLERAHPRFDLWLVPTFNPDGLAAGTRGNAHGVDLNRNFPSNWARIGHKGSLQWSGPHPLSEPESRAAYDLILKLRPQLTIWFHQPQDVVRAWGHSVAAGRRFARLSGLPYRSIHWPYGTASNWQNHKFGNAASFVVELPPGPLSASLESLLTRAVLAD